MSNSDGLLIKGIHTVYGDVAIMFLCRGKKAAGMAGILFSGRRAETVDKMVRGMEEQVELSVLMGESEREIRQRVRYYCKKISEGRYMKKISFIACVFCENRFMMIVSDRSMTIEGRILNCMKASDLSEFTKMASKDKNLMITEGTFSEAKTVLFCSESFLHLLSEKEIMEYLSPQMHTEEGSVEEALSELYEQIRRKGECRPVSAAALCIR